MNALFLTSIPSRILIARHDILTLEFCPMAHINQDRIADYDAAIDQLFEGLKGARYLLMAGRMENLGIALSDRTKERLVERHGMAAADIVCSTGYYRSDRLTAMELTAPPVKPTMIERIKSFFGRRKAVASSDEDLPRWARLVREKEQEAELLQARRDRVLGRPRPEPRIH